MVFWNIEGLNVREYNIQDFCLTGLVDTWSREDEEFILEGFESIFKCGKRIADRGRYPGALTVLYRSDLKKYVRGIESQLNGIIW